MFGNPKVASHLFAVLLSDKLFQDFICEAAACFLDCSPTDPSVLPKTAKGSSSLKEARLVSAAVLAPTQPQGTAVSSGGTEAGHAPCKQLV